MFLYKKSTDMGGHEEWRDFLMCLFGEAFMDTIPFDMHFDMCIMDMMQFAAKVKNYGKKDSVFDAKKVTEDIIRTVYDYANTSNQRDMPIIDKSFILLLDTSINVPRNKSTTQISRDGDEDDIIMDEAAYEKLITKLGISHDDYIIHRDMPPLSPEILNPTTIWRSNNLKWQLNSMIVSEILKHVKLGEDKMIIIDDAVVFSSPREYSETREKIIEEFGYHDKKPFDQEVLVSFVINQRMTQRFILYHDSQFARDESTGMGEADVKIGHYINLDDSKVKRYLIVSQDTDIIFILLMHMKRLVDPLTHKIDPSIVIWLDTQTPGDKCKFISRPYRFINVSLLYERIMTMFKEEYPTITCPVETFIFLVHCMDTDFTTRLGHTYLGVTRRVVWNVFSELHHVKGFPDTGYIVFDTASSVKKKERCKTYNYSPKIHNILGSNGGRPGAIYCQLYNIGDESVTLKHYNVGFDMDRCEEFFYFLCQLKLIDDMSLLKMHNSKLQTSVKPFYVDPATLFIHAQDILTNLSKFKEKKALEYDTTIKNLLDSVDCGVDDIPTKKPPSTTILKKPVTTSSFRPNFSSIGPAIKFVPQDRPMDTIGMNKLSTRNIPPYYGIPMRLEMKARLCRMAWVMNYIQNGTVCNYFTTCYGEPGELDPSLSKYGWTNKIVKPTTKNINSSYYQHRFNDVDADQCPIISTETLEIDNVC